MAEIQNLNKKLEILRTEKKESQKEKKYLIEKNKKKVEEIRRLRDKIEELENEEWINKN